MATQSPTPVLAVATFVALSVGLVACSVIVDNALSDRPAGSADAGVGGQGGTSATGGGGTDPGTGIRCGDQLLCIDAQRCCMVAGDPGAVHCAPDCPPDEIPIYCATQDDCPETTVCCADYSSMLQVLSVACVVTCDPKDFAFLVCTDQPSLCTGLLSCKQSVQLPAGLFVCSP